MIHESAYSQNCAVVIVTHNTKYLSDPGADMIKIKKSILIFLIINYSLLLGKLLIIHADLKKEWLYLSSQKQQFSDM